MVIARHTLEEMQTLLFEDASLQLLACPICRGSLKRIEGEAILCTSCGHRYPLRDGLPVLRANVTR